MKGTLRLSIVAYCLWHGVDASRLSRDSSSNGSLVMLRGARAGTTQVGMSMAIAHRNHACSRAGLQIGGAVAGDKTHYEARGCWKPRKLLHEVRYTVSVESAAECFAFCAKQESPGDMGLSFFGVERGDKCWCAAAYDGSRAGSKDCNLDCRSDDKPGCGGVSAANVYVMYDCSSSPQLFTLSNLVGGNNLGKTALRVIVAAESMKYSTMSASYRLKDVPKLLHGSKYLQGGDYKGLEPQGFTSNVPVIVYLAIDNRNDAKKFAPEGFTAVQGTTLSWTDGKSTASFHIFSKPFEAGEIRFKIKSKCMAGVFVMEQTGIQISNIVDASNTGTQEVQLVDVKTDSVAYCTGRQDLKFKHLKEDLVGGKYIKCSEEKGVGDIKFQAFRPVTVFVAIDGAVDHKAAAPNGFLATGGLVGFARGSETVQFHLYVKNFAPGKVRFRFRRRCMAGIFVTEPHETAAVQAKTRKGLLKSFGVFKGQTCGQADGNAITGIGGVLHGSVDSCKMACWDGPDAMQCHGFTYDTKREQCTFCYDVLDGDVKMGETTDCYFKIS